MQNILQKNDLFKTLFDAIPALCLVINSEGRVITLNSSMKNFLNITSEYAFLKKAGHVLHCINTIDAPDECGFRQACKSCILRQTGMNAINKNTVNRAKGKLELLVNDKHKVIYFMASSAPYNYNGTNMAVIIVEDISEIVNLKGLIPICASCKKVRDDEGYWSRLETYIENYSDAEFTHDICPDCIQKLYPKYCSNA
jgi:PAS domain-containing protein